MCGMLGYHMLWNVVCSAKCNVVCRAGRERVRGWGLM